MKEAGEGDEARKAGNRIIGEGGRWGWGGWLARGQRERGEVAGVGKSMARKDHDR